MHDGDACPLNQGMSKPPLALTDLVTPVRPPVNRSDGYLVAGS